MNKSFKRIVACCLLVAFALVLGACGADNSDMNNVVLVSIIGGGTAAPSDNGGSAAPATTPSGGSNSTPVTPVTPATTAANTANATTAAQTPATPDTPATTQPSADTPATTAAPVSNDGGLTSTDPSAIIDFYKTAYKNTEASSKSCNQAMALDELDGGEGGAGTFINLAKPIITSALNGNNKEVDWLPGHIDQLVASDCAKASATSDGSKTTIRIDFPEQTDPAKSSGDHGPVGHGISTLGDIDNALSSLGGITVDYSNGEISLKYYDAYLECTVDNASKTITSGKWHYKVYVAINNVNAKISFVSVTLNGAHAVIDYTLTK